MGMERADHTTWRARLWARRHGEAGEGVISAAIAVLVMAFIGAGMYLAFQATFDNASDTVDQQVEQIGG